MIEERGTVVEVRPGRALVATVRSGSCESCGSRRACGGLGGGRDATVWADDPVGVHPGDHRRWWPAVTKRQSCVEAEWWPARSKGEG